MLHRQWVFLFLCCKISTFCIESILLCAKYFIVHATQQCRWENFLHVHPLFIRLGRMGLEESFLRPVANGIAEGKHGNVADAQGDNNH